MKQQQVDEIIQCLPKGRTLFPYFRDRYAAMLLSWMFDDGCSIAHIKRSHFARLLEKQLLKEAIAHSGDGHMNEQLLSLSWPGQYEQFLLTLGCWGGDSWRWQQTTRPGHNLVLQVNLHDGYRRWFEETVPVDDQWRFSNIGHPVLTQEAHKFYRPTLGWVRIDLDFDTGEALIEEIQTDWLRDMRSLLNWYQRIDPDNKDAARLVLYCQSMLRRLETIWDEALMAAALWFIREELGIHHVWYHTFESGCRLKRIKGVRPPRSLYSGLPKRFCYTRTSEQPEFLLNERKIRRTMRQQPAPQWFKLDLH